MGQFVISAGHPFKKIVNSMSTYTDNSDENNVRLEYGKINLGIPQGFVLGPTLFLLYTNGLDILISNAFLVIYADDISMVSKSTDKLLEYK